MHLQILGLCKLSHADFVRQHLENLPSDLAETYREMYETITKDHNIADRQNALNALQWLICSTRPLNLQELLVLVKLSDVALRGEGPSTIDAYYMQKICHNLITVDVRLNEVRLIHVSVREFLELRADFPKNDCRHEMAAKTCFSHLLAAPVLSFLEPYIVQSWPVHYREAVDAMGSQITEVLRLTQEFLKHPKAHMEWLRQSADEELIANTDPLFTIARFNLHEICRDAVTYPNRYHINPNSRRTKFEGTPLHLAVRCGHDLVVKQLISGSNCEVIDVNAQDKDGQTALALAIIRRNHTIIELLLQCRTIDPNKPDTIGGFAPIVRASWVGDERAVELLLNMNCGGEITVQLNAADYTGRTAFHWAVIRRQLGIVHLLANAGADVNAQDRIGDASPILTFIDDASREHGTVTDVRKSRGLPVDSIHVDLEILQQLCELPGMNINLPDFHGLSPTGMLIHRYHCKMNPTIEGFIREGIKILLGSKLFNINLIHPVASPLLHVATKHCCKHSTKAVELLLRVPELNLNSLDNYLSWRKTALGCAVARGLIECVRAILNEGRGVDIRIPDFEGVIPLQSAIKHGYNDIAKLLILAEDLIDETVLKGLDDATWELLKEKAKISHSAVLEVLGIKENTTVLETVQSKHSDAWKNVYDTALRAFDHEEALEELEYLNINITNTEGFSVLYWAVIKSVLRNDDSATRVVQVLSNRNGIELNQSHPNTLQTPLCLAAQFGKLELVQILLTADGIDVNAADVRGHYPECTALRRGHLDIVKVLISDARVNLNVNSCSQGYSVLGMASSHEKGYDILTIIHAWCGVA